MSLVRIPRPGAVEFDLLEEPVLLFGGNRPARDPKVGLALSGPAGVDSDRHPAEIDMALVGTNRTIEEGMEWIETCSHLVPGKADKIRQVPDFPGFSPESPFKSKLRALSSPQGLITDVDIRGVTSHDKYEDGFRSAIDLLVEKVTLSCESLPGCHVVFCAVPQPIVDYCLEAGSHLSSGRAGSLLSKLLRLEHEFGQLRLFPSAVHETGPAEDIVYRNLRRALKGKTMKLKKPLQIGLESSLFSERSQHRATKAWNFCVAQYYKATGALPWKLEGMDPDTCFVGVSFFQQLTDESFKMRTSLAQVFSGDGAAFVVRGHQFHWDQKKSPHLPEEGAEALMKLILKRCAEFRAERLPRRIVIYKTSKFYNDEKEGFLAGLGTVRQYDFLSLQRTGTRFFREGGYPPLRRTYARQGDAHFLYTQGYIPDLGTYPKGYVPEPFHLLDWHGDTPPRRLFKETLALTKMNFNNVDFADGDPVTVRFARRIGEILAYVNEGEEYPHYRFYM